MSHYLDYASTSLLRGVAKDAMAESFEMFGDPSRIHKDGLEARYAIEKAREQVAEFIGAKPREVVFTSGATESIASAVFGAMEKNPDGKIITSSVEHSAVLESVQHFPHTKIGVDKYGILDLAELEVALTEKTAPENISLVSIQHANHEIGTLQDIATIAEMVKNAGSPYLHIDAAQSIGHIPFNFSKSNADFLSISAHKLGGPKGIGALLIKQGLRIEPLLKGGSQERLRRGGMENTTAIVGFGATMESLGDCLKAEAENAQKQTQLAIELCLQIEGITHYGHPEKRVPHIACFGFEDIEPQAILLELDRKGVSVHSGSACSSEDLQPSSVLEAIGVNADRSLRVSVGWNSTTEDIHAFIEGLKESLAYLRTLA